jgi:hypothetical protein
MRHRGRRGGAAGSPGGIGRLAALSALLVLALSAITGPANAADPNRWRMVNFREVPVEYFQGVTSAPGRLFFDGTAVGLYRTNARLRETGRVDNVIPPEVLAREGYNHIGDISYDRAEGGRILLPLECYYPGTQPDANTCETGSIGVADPRTLRWRYYVKLDPRFIPKAMWNEISPDGRLIWTSSGDDLIAYRAAEVRRGNAAPGGRLLRPVRRLRGAVPDHGITGAAFYRGRLFLAGQDEDRMRVTSVDLRTGDSRLEIERTIVGESEGLDVSPVLGGVLHWLIAPIPQGDNPNPTFGRGHSALVQFVPRRQRPANRRPAAIRRPALTGSR